MTTVTKTKRKPTGAAAMGAGPGRPKGSLNKTSRQIKEMVVGALEGAGGQAYLTRCAKDPKLAGAFLALVGKVLPLQVTGANGADMAMRLTIEYVRPDPDTTA
mgnify:CR=1 FL=1